MSKLWFAGMSGPGSLENIKELIDPIGDYFDGIVWVLHDSVDSQESAYLDIVNGDGATIHYYYNKRHNESRNQFLWCGPIQQDDWVVTCDDLERIPKVFAKDIKNLIAIFEAQGINIVYYYGKVFMFKHHESCRFDGSPHEAFRRQDGNGKAVELNHNFPNEKEIRENVRPQKRTDPFHWVYHYAKYMLFPWGSNHSLLGLEDRGSIQALYPIRESRRLSFIAEMRKRGFTVDLDGLKKMLSAPLDDTLKKYLNEEKVWNDFYRLVILNDETVIDEHKWTTLKKIA